MVNIQQGSICAGSLRDQRRTKMQANETQPRRITVRWLAALATLIVLGGLIVASRSNFGPQSVAAGDKAMANAVAKAKTFLDSLDAKQREKALLEFNSAKKPSWSNLPVTFVPRNGLALGELTKPQRAAALDVLAA